MTEKYSKTMYRHRRFEGDWLRLGVKKAASFHTKVTMQNRLNEVLARPGK